MVTIQKTTIADGIQSELKEIQVSSLDFDPENPRFPSEIASGSKAILIEKFIKEERLAEIILSIADQGYFAGEPLLVVENGKRYTVIEGNRRLAALKLLNGEISAPEGRTSIQDDCEAAKNKPTKVPCLVFKEQDQILRYLGFRHITGIKAWGPLQKARYIKRMRDSFYSHLEGKEQLSVLAREIGSRSDYVGLVLSTLNLYERAESKNFYNISGLDSKDIEFSVLSTALGYSTIAEFVGLDDRQDFIGNNVVDKHLEEILFWMFVSKSDQKSIVGDSRNLKKLAAIVDSEVALDYLRKEGNLEAAFQLSKGPAEGLSQLLKQIAKKLDNAWDWIPMVEDPIPDDANKADEIKKRAIAIRDALKAKDGNSDD